MTMSAAPVSNKIPGNRPQRLPVRQNTLIALPFEGILLDGGALRLIRPTCAGATTHS